MKKLGLFTGGLILLFALQLTAELIPLTVVNGDFEDPVVTPSSGETERALVDQVDYFPGWTISDISKQTFHCTDAYDPSADSQFIQLPQDNNYRIYTNVLQTSTKTGYFEPSVDYVAEVGDIITVKFNQSGTDGQKKVAVYLFATTIGDVNNYTEILAANNLGFDGKKFGEGVVVHHIVKEGSPLKDKNLRVAFRGVNLGRIDNVRVEVERPTVSNAIIPALPKAVKLADNGDKITIDYGDNLSDFENLSEVTFEMWIKRTGSEQNDTGLFFSRDGSDTAGLSIMSNGQLRHTWNNDFFKQGSGLNVPANEWAYVAMTLSTTSNEAFLYMYSGSTGWKKKPYTGNQYAKTVLDKLVVGADTANGKRTFKGDIAEARFWGTALTEQRLKFNMSKASPDVFGVKPLIHYNFNELTSAGNGGQVENQLSQKFPATINSNSAALTDFINRGYSLNFTGGGIKHIKVGEWGLETKNDLNSALTGADKDKLTIVRITDAEGNVVEDGDWTAEFYLKRYSEATSITNTHLTYRYNGITGLRLSTFKNTRRVGYSVAGSDVAFNNAFAPMQEWAHYVYVRKGSEIELFIDGESYGVTNEGRDITFRSIGAEVENCPEMELRTVRFWKRALQTPAEAEAAAIAADLPPEEAVSEIERFGLAKGGFTLTDAEDDSLVLYYDFNQLPGGKLVDLSANNLNGSLINFGDEAAQNAAFLPTIAASEQRVIATATSSTTATVEWTAIPGVYEYFVEYDTSSDFSNPTVVKVENATSLDLSLLVATTTYHVRVKSRTARTEGRVDYTDSFGSSTPFKLSMPADGRHVIMSGQLHDDEYKLVAGEEKWFRMTLKAGDEQAVDLTGTAEVSIASASDQLPIKADVNDVYGSVNGEILKKENSQGNDDLAGEGYKFNVEFVNGVMSAGEQITLSLNNVKNRNTVKLTVKLNGKDYTSFKPDRFIGWDELDISPSVPASLSVETEPSGVPNTINGGVLTVQPSLKATDAYGNVAVGEYTCVATPPEGSGWHIGGYKVSADADMGTFTYENFAVINGSKNLIIGNIDVNFSIEDSSATAVDTIQNVTLVPSLDAPGKSYLFDGVGYVNAGNVEALNIANTFTLSAWFKADEFVKNAAILQRYLDNDNRIFVGFGDKIGDVKFTIRHKNKSIEKAVTGQYELNEWVHVALEYDSTAPSQQVRLYVNNSPFSFDYALGTSIDLQDSDLLIGKNGAALFKGEIDEVKVYTSTKSIADAAIAVDKGSEEALALYYRFDSGLNNLFDMSKEGNHGTQADWSGVSETDSFAMGCPVSLPATDIKGTEFNANWDASVIKNPNSFDIEVSQDENFGSTIVTKTALGEKRQVNIDENLLDGEYYYYRTVANFPNNEERYSLPVAVLTQITDGDGVPVPAPRNSLILDGATFWEVKEQSVEFMDNWTLQTWVKPMAGVGKKVLVSGANGSILLSDGNGNVALDFGGGDVKPFAKSGIPADEWVNLTFTYNSTEEKVVLFVNGSKRSEIDVAFALEFAELSSDTNGFAGEIDEFVIWDKRLKSADVKDQMFVEKNTSDDLIPSIYYNFDLAGSQDTLQNIGTLGGSLELGDGGSVVFVSSEAWDKPIAFPATEITTTGFTANWRADKARGKVDVYISSVWNGGNLPADATVVDGELDGNLAVSVVEEGATRYYQVAYKGASVRSNVIQTFTAKPIPGNCMQFNRSEQTFVELAETDDLKGSNLENFTLEAWILTTGDDTEEYVGVIGSPSIDSGSQYRPILAPSISLTGEGKTRVQYGYGVDWGETYFATSDKIIEPYVWTHLAVTLSGNKTDGYKMTLYKNGVAVDSLDSIANPPYDSTYVKYIGKRTRKTKKTISPTGGYRNIGDEDDEGFFDGQIDEVRIWNSARTRKEILRNYNNEIQTDLDGLVAYYRFNKSGDATVVADLTGRGSNGEYKKVIYPETYTPWKKSYALLAPVIKGATNIVKNDITGEYSFTANWEKASIAGNAKDHYQATGYLLYVSEDPSFETALPGYDPMRIDDARTSQVVTIGNINKVYYKVSAINDEVTMASGYSEDIASLNSDSTFVITNKIPAPGNALKFDGVDDYITIDQTGGLDVGVGDFSVDFWVKNDFIRDDENPRYVICNKAAANSGSGWTISMNERGDICVTTRKGDGEKNANSSRRIADGNWHHVAIVFDRVNNVTVTYIDGVLDNSTSFANESLSATLSNDNPITIGIDPEFDNGRRFTGWLDDLRFWSKALNSDDVLTIKNNELFYADLPDGLELYYQFDEEGSEPAAIGDLTSNRHTGTMNNFADNDLDLVWQKSAAMGAPNDVEVTQLKPDSFKVSWSAPVNVQVDSYAIEISTDDFENVTVVAGAGQLPPAITNYTVTGLNASTPYYVRVVAKSSFYNEGRRESDVVVKSTLANSLPGAALSFDGIDDYALISPKLSELTNKLTFSAWVKVETGTLAAMSGRAVLFHTLCNPGESGSYFTVYLETNGKLSYHWDTDQTLKLSGNTVRIVEGEWNHIAVTLGSSQGDNGNKQGGFYITPVGVEETLSSFVTHNKFDKDLFCNLYGTTYLGGAPEGTAIRTPGTWFKGLLDEIQILSKTLQPDEVEILANSYTDANNPIGDQFLYLPFNENSGDTIGDLANERYAEIVGASWSTADYLTDNIFVKPPKRLTERGFTLQWDPVPGAAGGYKVKIYDLDGNPITAFKLYDLEGNLIEDDTSLTGTEAVVSDLADYGQYLYEVVALNSEGEEIESSSSGKQPVTTGVEEKENDGSFSFTPGYAVRLESGSSISGTSTIFGSAPEEFTVEFWCKPEEFVKRDEDKYSLFISSIDSSGSDSWTGFTFHTDAVANLITGTTSGNDTARINVSGAFEYIDALKDKFDPSGSTVIGKEPTVAPVWQHFAVTYNRGTMSVYRDGELFTSKTGIAPSAPWNGLIVKNYGGVIDELRVWSKELAITEIEDRMHSLVSPDSEYLRAYYRFDQRNLSNGIPDLTGNADLTDVSSLTPEVRASYAMVKPVAVDAKIDDVEKIIEVSFELSDVQPLGRERDPNGVFDNFKTEYRIQVATNQDFTTDNGNLKVDRLIEYLPLDPPAPGEKPLYEVEGGQGEYRVTLNDDSFDFAKAKAFYIRVLSSDAVKVNLNDSNDSEANSSFELGSSAASNELVLVYDSGEVPGNALYFPDNYPVSGKVDNYPVSDLQTSDFTVELWMQIAEDDTDMPVLVNKNLSLPHSSGWALTTVAGVPQFEISDDVETVSLSSGVSIADGQWHHVAVSINRDSSTARFYLDGQEVDSNSSLPLGEIGNSDILAFGQDITGLYTGQFKGAVDEIRIWSSSRSALSISNNMIDTVGVDDDLVSYYRCDLDSGNVLVDIVSQRNAKLSGELFRSWIKSYAMGCPVIEAATGIKFNSFNANWNAANVINPAVEYSLEVANNPQFEVDGKGENNAGVIYTGVDNSATVDQIPTESDPEATEPRDPVQLFSGGSYFYRVIGDYGDGVERTSKTYAVSTNVEYPFVPKYSMEIDSVLNEYCYIPSKQEFESPEVTVTAWFRANRPELGASGYGTLVSNRDSSGTRYTLHVANDLSEIQIWNGSQNQINYVDLEANKWYHVAAVMTATKTKMYINGEEVGLTVSNGIPSPLGLPLYIGTSDGVNGSFKGRIDEVTVWDHALTRDEIRNYINLELNGDESGLVGYYKFDNDEFLDDDSDLRYIPDMSQNAGDMKLENAVVTEHDQWKSSAALGCPQVLDPVNNTENAVYALWERPLTVDPEADFYTLAFSNNNSFESFGTDYLTEYSNLNSDGIYEVPVTKISNSSDERNGLLEGTTYYYQVFAEVAPGILRYSEVMPTSTLFKAPGNAIYFGGADNQFIDLGVRSELSANNLSTFTIETWVKPRRYNDAGDLVTGTNSGIGGIIGGTFTGNDNATVPALAVEETDSVRWGFITSNDENGVRTYRGPNTLDENGDQVYKQIQLVNNHGNNVWESTDGTLYEQTEGNPVVQREDDSYYIVDQGDEVTVTRVMVDDLGDPVYNGVFNEVRWYHLAFTFNGSDMKLYVDGHLADSFSFNSARPKANQIRYIGKYSQSAGYYDGEVDEVRIWQNAKSERELRTNIFRPIPEEEYNYDGSILNIPDATDLIAYYKFDQTGGLVTYDEVSREDIAQLSGFDDLSPMTYWITNDSDRVDRTDSGSFAFKTVFSFVENYNVGIIEDGNNDKPIAVSGLRVENVTELADEDADEDTDQDPFRTDGFVYYSQIMSPYNDRKSNTMSWGLSGQKVRSTQVTEQNWYIRGDGFDKDVTIDLTFNMLEISPEMYADISANKDFLERFEATVEYDYQLLWNSVEVLSDDLVYRDVTPYLTNEFDYDNVESQENITKDYANISLGKDHGTLTLRRIFLDDDGRYLGQADNDIIMVIDAFNQDNEVKPRRFDQENAQTGLFSTITFSEVYERDDVVYEFISYNRTYTRNDSEFYDITFRNVPLTTIRSSTAYDGNYFGLGISTDLSDFILTPAMGLEAHITVTTMGAKISWTVEDELGVAKYLVQKRNADGTWTTIEVVIVNSNGEYFIIDPDYKEGDEYRIVAVDKYGTEQAFAVGESSDSYFITLDEGWNLLSLPCSNVDASELEANISGGFWTWEDNAYKRVDSCPENLNGFWVHNPGDKVIVEVTGKAVTDATVNLEAGWNIYGPVENCDVPPAVEIAYGWSSAKYDEVVKDYNVMMVTRGYWMFSLTDDTVKLQNEQK